MSLFCTGNPAFRQIINHSAVPERGTGDAGVITVIAVGFRPFSAFVPPDGRCVCVLEVLERRAGDTTGDQAQAESLARLNDVAALAGLTPAERAAVGNFAVPPDPHP